MLVPVQNISKKTEILAQICFEPTEGQGNHFQHDWISFTICATIKNPFCYHPIAGIFSYSVNNILVFSLYALVSVRLWKFKDGGY